MKKVVIILLMVFVGWGCSDEGSINYHKMIGRFDFQMNRIYDNGQVGGQFSATKYLPVTKIELLENGKVVETTSAIKDGETNSFFIFEKLEFNKVYTVRVSLNKYYIRETKPFLIDNSKMSFYTPVMFHEEYGYYPQWLKPDDFYLDLMQLMDSNLVITDKDKLVDITSYPNPVSSEMFISVNVWQSSTVLIELLDFQGTVKDTISNGYFKAGNYQILHNLSDYSDGLYIIRMQRDSNEYIHTFIVGKILN